MLQVQDVLVAVLRAGAAEGTGTEDVVCTDVPARDGQSINHGGDRQSITLGIAVLPSCQHHGHPAILEPSLLLLHGKNYLIFHCNMVSQCRNLLNCSMVTRWI